MRATEVDEFDDFVRARASAMFRTAYLLTGDHHAAEDLVQEILEQMYVRWRHIRQTPEGYARRALVNRANNRWRLRRRRPETGLAAMPAGGEPGTSDRADEVVGRHVIVGALRTLPARQRAAVVLRFLDDLSVAEVAEALGCSAGAVKRHTSRGLAKLRELLDAPDPPPGEVCPPVAKVHTSQILEVLR